MFRLFFVFQKFTPSPRSLTSRLKSQKSQKEMHHLPTITSLRGDAAMLIFGSVASLFFAGKVWFTVCSSRWEVPLRHKRGLDGFWERGTSFGEASTDNNIVPTCCLLTFWWPDDGWIGGALRWWPAKNRGGNFCFGWVLLRKSCMFFWESKFKRMKKIQYFQLHWPRDMYIDVLASYTVCSVCWMGLFSVRKWPTESNNLWCRMMENLSR